MGVTIKKFGPWARFTNFPLRLARELPKIAEIGINREAQGLADALKATVEGGKAGGPRLSAETVARKGSSVKLVDSHALANSFTVEGVKAGGTGFVGIKEGTGHPSGISMTALAMIHEFGTATIPARPFLEPTLRSAGPKMLNGVVKYWQKEAKRVW